MLPSFLLKSWEISGPELGLCHDGYGGGAVCGHGVGGPGFSVPAIELGDGGEGGQVMNSQLSGDTLPAHWWWGRGRGPK